jgi:hypothetical protein
MTDLLLEGARVAVGAAVAYALLHLRVSFLEKSQHDLLERTEDCLKSLTHRVDDLQRLTARLEGYLQGKGGQTHQ